VVRATERCVTLKEEEIDNLMLCASVNPDARAKAEPEPTPFNITTDSPRMGSKGVDISRRHPLSTQRADEILDTSSLPFLAFISSDGDTQGFSKGGSAVSLCLRVETLQSRS